MPTFVELPGAVVGEGAAPRHYGNPILEQRALDAGARVLLERDVVRLAGPDRRAWLDSITSQSIATLERGVSTETLVLSPSGRIEHALRLVDDGTALWAIVAAGTGDDLAAWLTRMRFWNDVEIDVPSVAVVGWTPGADLDGVTWTDPWPAVLEGGVRYGSGDDAGPWDWHETIVEGELDAAATPVAGLDALEARRIAAGRPTIAEVDASTIPHELDWLATAVHLTKGCYRGQETVAKVHNLGSPPRRLTLLHLDGSESQLPVAGDAVHEGDREVGRVTVAAMHAELGPIALAVLKRSVAPDATLVVPTGDPVVRVAAAQQVLVPPEAGHANPRPRIPRLGAVRRPSA